MAHQPNNRERIERWFEILADDDPRIANPSPLRVANDHVLESILRSKPHPQLAEPYWYQDGARWRCALVRCSRFGGWRGVVR